MFWPFTLTNWYLAKHAPSISCKANCWGKTSQTTTWDGAQNPVNNGINYQPQLVPRDFFQSTIADFILGSHLLKEVNLKKTHPFFFGEKMDGLRRYCWWTKSCTTKDDDYPTVHRVLTIPGGAGFCPSTVLQYKVSVYYINIYQHVLSYLAINFNDYLH